MAVAHQAAEPLRVDCSPLRLPVRTGRVRPVGPGIPVDPDPGQVGQQPGDLIFAIAGDANRPWEHVRLLARLSRITIDEASRRRLREARDDAALLAALQAEDARHG